MGDRGRWGETDGDRRVGEEARGEEETLMTSKLRALDRSEPVWRHRLSEECCARRTANGETVWGFRYLWGEIPQYSHEIMTVEIWTFSVTGDFNLLSQFQELAASTLQYHTVKEPMDATQFKREQLIFFSYRNAECQPPHLGPIHTPNSQTSSPLV